LEVTAGEEFLHEEPSHDGLSGPRVVREKESKRLAGEHLLIDGGDLVRERFDYRSVNGKDRIEEVSQANSVRLRDQAELLPVAVEAPGPPRLGNLNRGFPIPKEEFIPGPSLRVLVEQLDAGGAEPLHVNYGDEPVGQNSPHRRSSR
jgi:hypothetical protein